MLKNDMTIDIMQDSSQKIHYEIPEIAFYIRKGYLSYYPGLKALCHWHEDIEIIQMLEGSMNYYVNGHHVYLQPGDAIVVNSSQMHYGYSHQGKDCLYQCILFSTSLLSGNMVLFQKYVKPIIENRNCNYFYLDKNIKEEKIILDLISEIGMVNQNEKNGYELKTYALLQNFWALLYEVKNLSSIPTQGIVDADLLLQKNMITYINENYSQKITLTDIASSANISVSKCCRIFKHYLNQSPLEYTNILRLKTSANLLLSTTESITQIALNCGFSNPSYFSELFLRYYGDTPRNYRKALHTF